MTKLADDRAEQLRRDPDKVTHELDARMRKDLQKTGDFGRIHPLPRASADVPDDLDARLVVLDSEHPYSKEAGNPAEVAAKEILEHRGNAPRLYRNTLVFLAVDKTRWQDLDEAIRKYLAWESILAERESLDLTPFQVKQAEQQKQAADGAVTSRLPEAYQWLLVPTQSTPQAPVVWQASRLSGTDALAVRASKKLKNEELLLPAFGPSRLRMELDRVPLWRGNHVGVKQLFDDFARYLYLPRLAGPEVLTQAIRDGLQMLTWQSETYAYAESFDESVGRYRSLRGGFVAHVSLDDPGLLVKPDVARRQIEAEVPESSSGGGDSTAKPRHPSEPRSILSPPAAVMPRRFHGSVMLDPARVGRDAGRIAEEVIAHLSGLVGAEVKVTLEIHAEIPSGAPDNVARIVTENCRTLKFDDHGFEKE